MTGRMLLATTVETPALADDVEPLSPLVVVPRFAEMKRALSGLGHVRTIVLTSGHAVDALVGGLFALGHDVRALFGIRLAVVGEATSARLQRHGLRADLVAHGGGRELAEEILAGELPDPILYPRALDGRPELGDLLRAAGRTIEIVSAYETHPDGPALKAALLRHHADPFSAFAFTSPRGVTAVLDVFGDRIRGARLGAIGATTRSALVEAGFARADIVVPDTPSVLALVDAVRSALTG